MANGSSQVLSTPTRLSHMSDVKSWCLACAIMYRWASMKQKQRRPKECSRRARSIFTWIGARIVLQGRTLGILRIAEKKESTLSVRATRPWAIQDPGLSKGSSSLEKRLHYCQQYRFDVELLSLVKITEKEMAFLGQVKSHRAKENWSCQYKADIFLMISSRTMAGFTRLVCSHSTQVGRLSTCP